MKMKKLLFTTTVALGLMIYTIASASSYLASGTRYDIISRSAYSWASYDYHTDICEMCLGIKIDDIVCGIWVCRYKFANIIRWNWCAICK